MAEEHLRPSSVGATSAQLGTRRSSPSPPSPESTSWASGHHPVRDLYADITQRVVEMLDKGVAPWRSPILGLSSAGHPKNLNSGKRYRGINIFLLAFTAWAKGYESSYWLTFQQARQRGGHVKKGERSSLVVFWKRIEPKDPQPDETGQPTKRQTFILRHYNVFNVVQCEGIDIPDAPKYTPTEFKPIERAERILAAYPTPPAIIHGGSQAFYRPKTDEIHLPEPGRFASVEAYYNTRYHESAHATGHSSRLDRKLDTDPKPFGTPDYGKEELIAEMAAAFLCGESGIEPAVIQNQASYISGWLGVIKADKRLVVTAAGAAQHAAEWIMNVKHDQEDTVAADAPHG